MVALNHESYMQRAIALATNVPEMPFASVIVHRGSGDIMAEGWNKSAINPIWHGEIDAVNILFRSGRVRVYSGEKVLYSTAEPCPMCMAAILWSGIGMVVFGTSIRFLKNNGWRQIDVFAEEIVRRSPDWKCTVLGGIFEPKCNALFASRPLKVFSGFREADH